MKNPFDIKTIEKAFEPAKEIILITSKNALINPARIIIIFEGKINEEIIDAYKLLHNFNNGEIDSLIITPNNDRFDILLKMGDYPPIEIKELICSQYSMYESFINFSNSKTLFVFYYGTYENKEDLLSDNYVNDNSKIRVKELIIGH